MQQYRTRQGDRQDDANESLRGQLRASEREKDRTLEELREFKRRMNLRSDSIACDKAKNQEINSLKESLLNANKELRNKNKTIESLRSEVDQMKQLELKLEEKNSSMQMMKEELSNLKSSMSLTEGLLSDSKIEIASLHEKMQESEEENRQKYEAAKEIIEKLGNELQMIRDHGDNSDKSSSIEAQTLFEDIEVLKNELKQAIEAEYNSKKAMDDFAVALQEVTSESYHTKEKLEAAEQQLQVVTEETANLKMLVNELTVERDRLKNTVERLRLEADESLLAWNQKEIEFVRCIKETEDEKYTLGESTREAVEMSNKLKDEIRKLRDVLKQALNEANVAKEAANLARTENCYLKDFLTEKDRALVSLAQENECLRTNEAEANENMKELRRLIKLGVKKERKEPKKAAKKESSNDSNDKESKHVRKFSFDMNQIWSPRPSKDIDEEPENDDALGGSIFDILESSVKEGETRHHHKRNSSVCSDDGKSLNLENFDEGEHFDDSDVDRNLQGKRKALIKRFGDLLRRKKLSASQGSITKDLSQPQKEITV